MSLVTMAPGMAEHVAMNSGLCGVVVAGHGDGLRATADRVRNAVAALRNPDEPSDSLASFVSELVEVADGYLLWFDVADLETEPGAVEDLVATMESAASDVAQSPVEIRPATQAELAAPESSGVARRDDEVLAAWPPEVTWPSGGRVLYAQGSNVESQVEVGFDRVSRSVLREMQRDLKAAGFVVRSEKRERERGRRERRLVFERVDLRGRITARWGRNVRIAPMVVSISVRPLDHS